MATVEPLRSWDAQDAERVVRQGRWSEPPRPTNIDALFRANEQCNGCDDANFDRYYKRPSRLSSPRVFAVCFVLLVLLCVYDFVRWAMERFA